LSDMASSCLLSLPSTEAEHNPFGGPVSAQLMAAFFGPYRRFR